MPTTHTRTCMVCGTRLYKKLHGCRSTCSEQCKEQWRKPGYSQPDPTPEEIQARAAEIRAEWSDEEEQRRRAS